METHYLLLDTVVASKPFLKALWEFIAGHIEWIVSGIIAVGTYLAFKIRKAIKWVKEMSLLKHEIPEIKLALGTMNTTLGAIKNEFLPNGNSSFKDQLNRIEGLVWNMREKSPDGEFTADIAGNWTQANRAFLTMVGATEERIKNLGWLEYLSDTDAEDVREKYLQAIAEKRGVSFKCHFKRESDALWATTFTLEPLRGGGKILSYIGKIVKKT